MAKNANSKKLVEVGLNKYGQRLDEFNEFGQSLEAEAWYFDTAVELPVAPAPALECTIWPARENKHFMTDHTITTKPVEVGLNKYGQRLDEFNEFGQSLEAEAWYFDTAVELPVAPAPALEFFIRPAHEKKQAAAGIGTSLAGAHLRAA